MSNTWMTLTEFAAWVSERRKAAGLSQEALSRAIGMSRGYVGQLEFGGIGKPTRGVIFAFADVFGEEVGRVLSMAGFDDPDLEQFLYVLETDRHLKPEQKHLLRQTYLALRDLNDER